MVTDLDSFTTAAREDLAAGELTCLVAKVEEIGPASFHMDLHLLENRFEFARALRVGESGDTEPPRPAPREPGRQTAEPTVAGAEHPEPGPDAASST